MENYQPANTKNSQMTKTAKEETPEEQEEEELGYGRWLAYEQDMQRRRRMARALQLRCYLQAKEFRQLE